LINDFGIIVTVVLFSFSFYLYNWPFLTVISN